MNIIIVLKTLFSLLLFFIFLLKFGLPSWKKYQARQIFVQKKKVNVHDIPPPAVTFCALAPTGDGWEKKTDEKTSFVFDISADKNDVANSTSEIANISTFMEGMGNLFAGMGNSLDTESIPTIFDKCDDSTSIQEIFDCVKNKTFSLEETVDAAGLEVTPGNTTDLLNSSFWISDISWVPVGKCHTLNNSVSLGNYKWTFNLDQQSYFLFIHDPNFFLFTFNPATIPSIYLQLNMGQKGLYIDGVRHVKMNTPAQPCEDAEGYSFTACVKESVAKKVGCRYDMVCQLTMHNE